MEHEGRTAKLLTMRATEYRALGDLANAAKDLREATQKDAAYVPAMFELARVLISQREFDEAATVIKRGIGRVRNTPHEAAFYMLRSEISEARGDEKSAAADVMRAIGLNMGDIEAHLRLSRLFWKQNLAAERIEALHQAVRANPGGVLEIELTEALIDGGLFEDALKRIEPELADSRFQSSWLIRRARALQGLERDRAAAADLLAAIDEIETRLQPTREDVSLVVDWSIAHALLGNTDLARDGYHKAKSLRADNYDLARIESFLRNR